MDISKISQEQKLALCSSLEYQKTPMTTAEKKTLNELRIDLAEKVETEMGVNVLRFGDLVRIPDEDFDTFGEDYRNRWLKVRESSKGEYFKSHYLSPSGNAVRIYLK